MAYLEIDYRIQKRKMKRRQDEVFKRMEEVRKRAKEMKALKKKEEKKVIPHKRRYKPLKNPYVYGRTRRYYRNHR